ncbi:hypothetical protein [Rhizobium ecuadorense]|uniref:hypothetical protein n=1 Tax=Rhizobium ecuadorense TaxID=1671795 RepID=UPI000A97E931|nr:hypothetical protein [Rhizobium ecuadorense]
MDEISSLIAIESCGLRRNHPRLSVAIEVRGIVAKATRQRRTAGNGMKTLAEPDAGAFARKTAAPETRHGMFRSIINDIPMA